jgi:diguanylate cyclase (GGDEF)-like protein/PAS domain S-box-containing protein
MLDISERSYLQESSERDRLEELRSYAIAGTEPEPRFDTIARVAGNLFKMPMAFLTLVEEDRQWFKAAIGSDMTETPRSVSFCTHAIMSDEVLVIPDAASDPRFADNPMVTGAPGVRFYAGAPLVTENGLRLGALCVVDTVPREFTSEQRVALRELAGLAMHQIAARRSEFSTVALAGLAQSLGQPLFAVGHHGVIEFANRPAAEFFGRPLTELRGMRMDELISAGRLGMDAEGLIAVFQDAETGLVSRPFKRAAVKSDGSEVPVEISVSRWDAAAGTGIAIVLRDLAEKAASAFKGLNDVRQARGAVPASDVAVTRLLDQLARDGKPVGLFLLSLDGFEALCEKLGRHMGHTVLQSATVRLQRLLPGAAIVARAKSDDFAIVVPGVENAADGHGVSERLARSFEDVFDLGVRLLQLTASVGFAIGSLHGDTAGALIANAALALQEARRAGGRKVLMYDDTLRLRSSERHQVQLELTRALRNNEFCLFYQPQVSLLDGRILGVEALIRWRHPTRGLLRPQDFLMDIEEGSLSLPIGWWTLERACAQLAAWRAEGLPDIRMSVNLFSSQFRSERLLPFVTELLERHAIAPQLLELEVTETIALLHDAQGLSSLNALRDRGVRIAFDDFGTGYASLSSLQQFPLTTLKLDRSFVRNILTNANDAVITRSMIGMANDLNLVTIAEGVETAEQEAFLRMLGCRLGQGYLYSKPISAEEMSNMLVREADSPVPRIATV